jgi:hypothetical protein
MAVRLDDLLRQHPVNPVDNPGYPSDTNKQWALKYPIIRNLRVHTRTNTAGYVDADYEGIFLPEYADDALRRSAYGYPPNARQWRFDTESSIQLWFETEISNIVLAAWNRYPILLQSLQSPPLREQTVAETVDSQYSLRLSNGARVPVVIAESKRNLISARQWQQGRLETTNQERLSRELRGRVFLYKMLKKPLTLLCTK